MVSMILLCEITNTTMGMIIITTVDAADTPAREMDPVVS
jgi:hypothetical protein